MAKRLKGSKKFALCGLERLRGAKNLLGFSAGVDSSALFYLLMAEEIPFDVAIVDYQMRKQSKKEVRHAKILAQKYQKKIFIHKAKKIKQNFESDARVVRREFFNKIMTQNNYDNLILAHQLNDRVEWLLMQLSKGCGLNSLLGFEDKSGDFGVVRPLFNTSRGEIMRFLHKNKIKYFVDKSNFDENLRRNFFRKHFANELVQHFGSGILKSLEFLQNDYEVLFNSKIACVKAVQNPQGVFIFRFENDILDLHNIEKCAKKLGYVLSQKQRSEIVKSGYSCVVADKIVIDNNKDLIFVAKQIAKPPKIDKKMREILRMAKIPPRIRPFVRDLEMFKEAIKEAKS